MWCSESDIDKLLSKLPVGSGISKTDFITKAETVMNTYFLGTYVLPISIPSTIDSITSGTTTALLKSIQEDLATGTFLLSLASVHEVDSLHSYAKDLEKRALSTLSDIKTGKLTLIGVTIDTDPSDDAAKPSKILSSSPDTLDSAFTTSSEAKDSRSFFNRPLRETGGDYYDTERD